ncbi:hypothetical protein NDI37_09950 [Funiculus sociatus GB2-A5]|uniref:Uncharacterized protein n=1 Tax=Funiculus sociatus GB2-A5 TaxID=2933946 RepID=A0ABV0JMX1_9CYAN|nr:hypothetical protein [Trichocoleus sp. FACHB-6]MBD1907822.1 hypothetical protein [Trichocoleus sp. FACHB-832]MBD2064000.1 hypothetical protein [Trichocoleus sp. FACHB-6]
MRSLFSLQRRRDAIASASPCEMSSYNIRCAVAAIVLFVTEERRCDRFLLALLLCINQILSNVPAL